MSFVGSQPGSNVQEYIVLRSGHPSVCLSVKLQNFSLECNSQYAQGTYLVCISKFLSQALSDDIYGSPCHDSFCPGEDMVFNKRKFICFKVVNVYMFFFSNFR